MAQLDKTFPTNDCAMCILSPRLLEISRHPAIELLTSSRMVRLEGEAGNFRAVLHRSPSLCRPRHMHRLRRMYPGLPGKNS